MNNLNNTKVQRVTRKKNITQVSFYFADLHNKYFYIQEHPLCTKKATP